MFALRMYGLAVVSRLARLSGTGVLAVGLWLRFDERTKGIFTGEQSPSVFLTGVYILIVAGAIMMVVGFLGCCGAIKESPCMLGLIVRDLQQFYTETLSKYKETKQEALRETLRAIHYGLKCCGTTGTFLDASSDICHKKEGLEILVTQNCPAAIDEIFTSRLHVIGGDGIGIGVIMIFGMIFSMLLCCAIRRTRDIV
ncbi:CD9 antigen-like isoform X1 [Labeo rohita]|uniref:Tetraspanin n=1 Tax=Labeo rohita TaxID=84645 RepID=A0A498MN46_LABRO|nr:CD9 antigen-like isoform X1 [Labeo rohita]